MFQVLLPGSCRVVFVLSLAGSLSLAQAAQDPVQVTMERLKTVHKALLAYEQKYHQWPDHLSELVPEFLPDKSALLDPADPGTGDLGSNQAHKDPKFHVSYSYERNTKVSRGLPCPLGNFPKPDIPDTGWGSWRHVNGHQEYFFGDQVPLVRCYLHRPPEEGRESGKDLVFNLTPAGRVYRSDFEWDKHVDSIAFVLRTLQRDITQGAGHVRRHWYLGRFDEYLSDCGALEPGTHGAPLRDIAEQLLAQREEFPGEQRLICRLAARIDLRLARYPQALAALEMCRKYAGDDKPIVEWQMQAEAHRGLKQWDKMIGVLEQLLAERPGIRSYMSDLAEAYAAKGDHEKAKDWRRKADPGAQLVGKAAPEFRLTRLDGTSLMLADARKGKKTVLLCFWFCGCQPCRLEFPHLQEIYKEQQGHGLQIVAVNHGDGKEAITKFVADKYTFPVCLGNGDGERPNPIFKTYHVAAYPTSYLIDARGRVIWRGEGFGPELKQQLAAALATAGLPIREQREPPKKREQ